MVAWLMSIEALVATKGIRVRKLTSNTAIGLDARRERRPAAAKTEPIKLLTA
jgi:hypothetical protein